VQQDLQGRGTGKAAHLREKLNPYDSATSSACDGLPIPHHYCKQYSPTLFLCKSLV